MNTKAIQNKAAALRTVSAPSRGLRSGWFMGAVLVVLLCGIVAGAHLALQTTRDVRMAALEREMALQIQQKVADLTVWFGSLSGNAREFAASDPVRLFAAEAAENKGRMEGLTRQRKFLISQFGEFVLRNQLIAAALYLDERGPMLESGKQLPLASALAADLRVVLEKGQMYVRPIRLDAHNDPMLDILVPVYAPQYVEASGRKCVGVVMLSVDIASRVRKSSLVNSDMAGEFGILLQNFGDTLHTLPGVNTPSQTLGPDWKPENSPLGVMVLPVATRQLPLPRYHGEGLISRGLAVPGTPWFVVQGIPVSDFEESYASFRNGVVTVAVVLSVLLALVLYLMWWRLLARQDRMTSAQLHTLYRTVNRQMQLLEGINSSVDAGIVLCGSKGTILYANAAFARMAGESPASVLNKSCDALLASSVAQCLSEKFAVASSSGEAQSCTQDLVIRGENRHFLLSSKPFTAKLGKDVEDTGVVFAFRDVTELLQLQARTSKMLATTVQAFVRAVEAVDSYLHGHSRRITALSVALAHHMQLSHSEPILATAAQLSHLGMIRLPRDLLSKAGAYTHAERMELENHVPYALEALADVDFGMPVQRAIAHMYERMDGSGYPCKLKGQEICIEGRILGVASAFCAMMRPRSYRRALTMKQSFEMLWKNSDKYDPIVLQALSEFLATEQGEAFLVLFGSKGEDVENLDAPNFLR